MFTKQTDLPSHHGVLQIPNLPAWFLHEHNIDVNILAFVRLTGSHLIVPFIQSHLHDHYSQHVHIYTDGSATTTTAGCGVYNKRYAITLTQTSSSFSSELYAILHVLYWLFTCKYMKALILTYTLSALQTIDTENWDKHSFTNKIHFLSSNLRTEGYGVVFMWVPGHSGIRGNDMADSLTKLTSSSTLMHTPTRTPIEKLHTLLCIHRMCVRSSQATV